MKPRSLFVMQKFYLALEVAWLQLLKQSSFLKISKIFMFFHFFNLKIAKLNIDIYPVNRSKSQVSISI